MTLKSLLIGKMITAAESLNTDLISIEEEEHVLVQAVMSIKTIIERDPRNHEKVW